MSLGLSHAFRWSSFSSAALLAVIATPALAAETAPKPQAPAPPADYMSPLKHLAFNDSGSVWLDFGGQLRARHEYWNNLNTGKTEGGFLLTRVLASADLHVGEQVRVFVEGQSAFSTDRDLPGGRRTLDVDELNLQQAYVELAVPAVGDLKTSIKAGRMGFNFGKQRLVSTLPWANTQRAWDGVDAVFKYEGWQADAFYTEFAPVQKYDFDTADGQTQFYGAYATGPLAGETLKMDVYGLGLTLSDPVTWNGTTGAEERYTTGTRLFGKDKDSGFDCDAEGAYQFGRVGAQDVSAWMIGTELGWNAGDAAKTRLFAGFDYASGDDKAGGEVNTFRQLYPLGHAYYGQADVLGRQNGGDLFAGVSFSPVKDLGLTASFHHFMRASSKDAIYNVGGGVATGVAALTTSKDVGNEIDLKATYKVDAHLMLEVGYSHFFAGKAYATGSPAIGNNVDFAYSQVMFKF